MKPTLLRRLQLATAALLAFTALPAQAQLSVDVTGEIDSNVKVAVPPLPAQQEVATPAGSATELGRKIAEVIAADLKGSGLFDPSGPGGLPVIPFAEVTFPQFDKWGAYQALVQGFVRTSGGESDITVGCYLYDVALKQELTRQGFVVAPRDWRRAAHKCADAIYARLSGESPFFDSRIAYIAESGPKGARVKRLAIMDSDGANHRFITNGQSMALTPRFSPDERRIAYMSYQNDKPSLYVYDLANGTQRLLVTNVSMAFAPRFSPDGRWILFTMSVAGNADVYRIPATGGTPQRLTTAPGIDTGGSYSPDGSKIVFESDRSGSQQLYVMNADGSNQQRISFGGGRYATPSWSPRGDLIAFTKQSGGKFSIGVMKPDGSGERILTTGFHNEGPTWAPNGRVLMFFRQNAGAGGPQLYSIDLTGYNEQLVKTPSYGSDPAWSPLLE